MSKKEQGELALQIIGDYPLYASTSGVTYEEAIKIAKVFAPVSEWKEWVAEL